jgi:hypothetical protein
VPPFRGTSALAVLRSVTDQDPPPVRSLNPSVPAWLEVFITRLLAKDPGDRFPGAAEVAGRLDDYLAHLRQPATVPAPDLLPAPRRPDAKGGGARTVPGRLLLVCLALLLPLGTVLLAGQLTEPGSRETTAEFAHDFRGGPLPPQLTQFGDSQCLLLEPEGLRFTLPKDRQDQEPVGIATGFEFGGDFEITTTFEILQAVPPPAGYGVGVTLVVKKAPPVRGEAAVGRVVRPGARDLVIWDRLLDQPGPDGKPVSEAGFSPRAAKVGRLRLKRTGATLHYLWAAGTTGDEFEEIHQGEFGREDLGRVIVSGVTGRQPRDLDARILDLRVRWAPTPPAKAAGHGWLALALAFALVAGIGLALFRARRPAAKRPEAGAPAAAVRCACAHCGKSLKAAPGLAGKRVRCPACGRATTVPDAAAGGTASTPL